MTRALLAGLVGLMTATAVRAQVPGINLNLFPRVGLYQPLGSLGELGGEDLKLQSGPAIGLSAELALPILPFNIRASMDYALGAGADHPNIVDSDDETTVLGLAADLVLRLAPGVSPLQPYLLGGIGVRKYDFPDANPLFPPDASDTALHLGAGLSFGLGPLKVVGEVSDYLSKFELNADDDTVRNDVFVMIGFKIGMF